MTCPFVKMYLTIIYFIYLVAFTLAPIYKYLFTLLFTLIFKCCICPELFSASICDVFCSVTFFLVLV